MERVAPDAGCKMPWNLAFAIDYVYGELAEWLMAPVLKTGIPGRVSGVRIPHSPPLAHWLSSRAASPAGIFSSCRNKALILVAALERYKSYRVGCGRLLRRAASPSDS